jgi:hypothetical protein
MDERPEISFVLGASGSFDPDYVTRELEIQPTVARKQGDRVGKDKETTVRFDTWYINSPKTRGCGFVDYLLDFLKNFEGKKEKLKSLSANESITFYLTAYISMFHGMQRPEIQIETSVMQKIIDFGLTFNIAIYCECCDEDGEDNG